MTGCPCPFPIRQRQVFSALSQIAKHSVDLAEMVVEAEIFPAVLGCLKDPDEYVKKNVATLMREITKHTPEVSKLPLAGCGSAERRVTWEPKKIELFALSVDEQVQCHACSLSSRSELAIPLN